MAIQSKTTSLLRQMDHTVAAEEEAVVNASAVIATASKEVHRHPSCSTGMGFAAANRYQITNATAEGAFQIVMAAFAVEAFQNQGERCFRITAVVGQVVILDR